MTTETVTPAPTTETPAATVVTEKVETPAGEKPAGEVTPPPEKAGDKTPAAKTEDESLLFNEKKEGEEKPEVEKKEGEKDGEKEGDKDGEKPPAFDITKLTIPEDMPLPEAMKADVAKLAETLSDPKLTPQERMQAATDMHVKVQNQQLEDWRTIKKGWRTEVENDPVIGGANLDASVKNANDIVRKYGDEQLKDDLILLGLGNKLSFVKFLNKIAGVTANDSIGDTKTGVAEEKKDAASILYPNMK